jgi:hypothetical protein
MAVADHDYDHDYPFPCFAFGLMIPCSMRVKWLFALLFETAAEQLMDSDW